jgi:hypothetical protein
MYRNNGVGMNEAIDLAVAEAEPPTGGVPDGAGARKQSAATKLPRYVPCPYSIIFIILFIS